MTLASEIVHMLIMYSTQYRRTQVNVGRLLFITVVTKGVDRH